MASAHPSHADYRHSLRTSMALSSVSAICPDVTTAHIERLIEAFAPDEGRDICVPTFNGKRGNPVLWARHYIEEMATLSGDVGARRLIGEHADAVVEVPMPDGGVLLDLDTPEALAARTSGGEG